MLTDIIKKAHRQIFRYDENIGHMFISNLNARIMNENGGYFVRTNSAGFRSNINYEKRKSNKPRILFFGDSITAGDGVNNDQRFSDLIGKYFSAEVHNYAVSGTGTDQQYLIWENYAKNVEADLIIIGVFIENIERNKVKYRETINPYTGSNSFIPKPFFRIINNNLQLSDQPVEKIASSNIINQNPKDIQWIIPPNKIYLFKILNEFRSSKSYRFLQSLLGPLIRIIRAQIVKNFYSPYPDYGNESSKGYQLMYRILNKFMGSIKDTPIIVMPIPTFQHYYDGVAPNYMPLFNKINNPDDNIFVIDLLRHFKKFNYQDRRLLSFLEDKTHFTKFGHEIISELLKDIINNNSLLHTKIDDSISRLNKKPLREKSVYILGISAFYHDSAAAIIKDGQIIAACQEERFSRIKNDRRFPISAINFCLEQAKIHQDELSAIVYYDNTFVTMERMLWTYATTYPKSKISWIKSLPAWVKYKLSIVSLIRNKVVYNGKILQSLHHRSHCSAAFYPSPFKTAAILTIDGVGEWATASIGIGNENNIKILKEILYPNSLGIVYSAFTEFIGFKVNSGEYKMMGLAPYGKPKYVDIILNNILKLKDNGSFVINQAYFDYMGGSEMTNEKFSDLFGGPGRLPETKITQREMDIARSIQEVTERVIINMAKYVKEITKSEYLCLAGGVALNCVANGKLLNMGLFKDIWIQPAAGDAGSALGCAFDIYHTYYGKPRSTNNNLESIQNGSFWGPEWSQEEINGYLDSEHIKYKTIDSNNRGETIAKYIDSGKVVGHYSGRTEFGPRALGSRSIIGDARSPEMQAKINLKIKYRESFRPFAPSVLIDRCKDYFDLKVASPYMLLVAPVLKKSRISVKEPKGNDILDIVRQVRSDIPAITHVDYSARVQTVSKEYNNQYYEVLSSFEKITGCGIIINTSFNVRGEPIVNSPYDAYQCFMKTEMDILVIGNSLLTKKDVKIEAIDNEKNQIVELIDDVDIDLKKELQKIYFKHFSKISKELNHKKSTPTSDNWVDAKTYYNSKDIFDINFEDDKEKLIPKDFSKEITKYWYNEDLVESFTLLVEKISYLSKKYKLEEENNPAVSDKIYEMF